MENTNNFLLLNKARKARLCTYERKNKRAAIMKEVYVFSRVLSTLKRGGIFRDVAIVAEQFTYHEIDPSSSPC